MFTRGLPVAEVWRRIPRLVLAFVLIAFAIALTVRADLGLSPWDVLHQGVGARTGIPIGTAGVLVGLVVLLAWFPLKERPGVGTVLNVLLIGAFIDLWLLVLPDPAGGPARWTELLVGTLLLGPGIALYLTAELGAGPRDGVMTALVGRGWSLRVIRTLMELAVLGIGWLLGGTVGVGTVLLAVTVGPNIHYFMDRFRLPAPGDPDAEPPVAAATAAD